MDKEQLKAVIAGAIERFAINPTGNLAEEIAIAIHKAEGIQSSFPEEEILKFGKHKGKHYTQVDANYLEWLIEQDWFVEKNTGLYTLIAVFLNKQDTASLQTPSYDEDEPYFNPDDDIPS